MTASSPTRGMLYSTPPDYDVFESPRSERATHEAETTDRTINEASEETDDGTTDETTTPAGTDESSTPMMTRANWTGSVSADD